MNMRLVVAALLCAISSPAIAQQDGALFAIKSGETLSLKPLSWNSTTACAPLFQGVESIDIMEGPPSLSLSFEPGTIHVAWSGCPNGMDVPGGHIMLTAKGVTEKTEANLIYRIRLKSRTGDAQLTYTNHVIVFPERK